jgi:hypothetical protein
MIDQILYALGVIATILGIVQGIIWVLGGGPKSSGHCLYLFFDCEKDSLIEETEYEFSWGWVLFLRKIFLLSVLEGTICKLSCKPKAGPRRPLPNSCYTVKKVDSKCKVMLVRDEYFKEHEIEKVYVHSTTHADKKSYYDNIEVSCDSNSLNIKNMNEVEIRNYLVALPDNVTLDKASNFLGVISGIIVPDTSTQIDAPLQIRIRKIGPKQGDDPCVLTIPFSL